MIRLREAGLLAFTKLRTRRIRTGVTVFASGLLFAGLVGALIVAEGTQRSIKSFEEEGLNSRYIVATSVDQPNSAGAFRSSAVANRAQQIYDQLVVGKKAAAKRLNLAYDASTEPEPTIEIPAAMNQTKTVQRVNPRSLAGQQAIEEYAKAHPDPGLPELKVDANRYHPIAFYSTTASTVDGTLKTMQDGNESFVDNAQSSVDRRKDILQTNGLSLTDSALVRSFLFPNNKVKNDAIPVIITYSQASMLLGLTPPSGSIPIAQRSEYIKKLYLKAHTITFNACYRNSVSERQIETAASQAQEIEKNKDNKDYRKPQLIYGLPAANSCGQATIVSDTRTTAEKMQQQKQDEFDKLFGQEVEPAQEKITFQVAGLKPDQSLDGHSTTTGDILKNVVGSSLDSTVTIPSTLFDRVPNAAHIKSILFTSFADPYGGFSGFPSTTYFTEFADAADARNFIDQKSCTTGPDGKCGTTDKPFQLHAYGSNSIGIQDLKNKFVNIFEISTIVVVVLACIIMGTTIGRMIADGRRETAVFRAIGAKRGDIASIYFIYAFCLSCYVALFALVAGVVAAYLFDQHFWQSTTVQAQLLFGASDSSREFHFFGLTPLIWFIVLASIMCGLFSALLPLIRNVRRSPINDMREE